ncbi:MAG: aminotransferase class IV [Candidatus Omnitrophica bacterium]|nr:aminotransferase class IV [Candidatus Omnitrophota bacterium]
MITRVAYVNNKYVPLDKASIPVVDRGFLYGEGIFETMRAYNGTVFLCEKHIARLFKSLRMLCIKFDMRKTDAQRVIHRLLKMNRLKDAYVKMIVTGGKSGGRLSSSGKKNPAVIIYTLPCVPVPRELYTKGVRVSVSPVVSYERSFLRTNKTLSYLENIMSRKEAAKKGFYDNVSINTKGFVTEASSSNIFMVKNGKIYTPPLSAGILPGVTRGKVMLLSKIFLKRTVLECFFKKKAIYEADEAFLTNTLIEIVPVTKIDAQTIGGGTPGAVTKGIINIFRLEVKRYCTDREVK